MPVTVSPPDLKKIMTGGGGGFGQSEKKPGYATGHHLSLDNCHLVSTYAESVSTLMVTSSASSNE